MKSKYLIFLFLLSIFVVACTPQSITITKYQCQNGQIVDSINLCDEQKCQEKICPPIPQKICKNASEPYVDKVEYEYSFNYGMVDYKTQADIEETPQGSLNYFTKQITKIKNFDTGAGNFKVMHHYRTLKIEETKEISALVKSGETKEFNSTFDNAFGEDIEVKTIVIAPTESRSREVIKYKNVERCSCE